MADVARRCPTCGSEVRISEVAESFLCPACKVRIPVVAAAGGGETKPRLQASEAEAPPAAPKAARRLQLRDGPPGVHPLPDAESPQVAAKGEDLRPRVRAKPREGAVTTAYHMGSWLAFLALGSALAWLRYGGGLSAERLDAWREAAPYVVLFLHTILVLGAFSESVFAGILSFLIPPYVYYHLFAVCDRFYLRAVVAGVLVGVAQDGFGAVAGWVAEWANSVEAYIRSGG